MPRIRAIKPEFWADEDIAKLPRDARLLFIGTWNLADDYGILKSNLKWIKAQLFPYDDDLRINQVSQWVDQLVKARMLLPFSIDEEGYLYIRTFKTHQKIDRPSKNGFISAEKLAIAFKLPRPPGNYEEYSESIRRVFAPGKGNGKEMEKEIGNGKPPEAGVGDPAGRDAPQDSHVLYKNLEKNKKSIVDFIRQKKPDFIEPYVDLWNLFAGEKSLAKVLKVTDLRKKHFKVRISENGFDFLQILKKAADSSFLFTGKWFGFDWIIESEENYTKVLEGKYDKMINSKPPAQSEIITNKGLKREINYLYEMFKENDTAINESKIEELHFKELNSSSLLADIENKMDDIRKTAQEKLNGSADQQMILLLMKKLFVIEFFKQQKSRNAETIFRVD